VRRVLLTTGLVVALAWGVLMLATLAAGIADRDAFVIVYAASASAVCAWGVWLWLRRQRVRRDDAALPAVIAAAASPLGPLAFLLLGFRRVRRAALAPEPPPEAPTTEREPKRAPVSSVYADPSARGSVVVYQPSSVYAPPPSQRRPTRALTWQLILAVVAFPVVLLFVAAYLAFGYTVVTPGVMRNVALGAAGISGAAIVLAAFLWFIGLSRAEKPESRTPGAVMIGVAAILVLGGTVYLGTQSSPRNVERPSVSGSPHVKARLTAEPGRWNEPRLLFAYQWQRCDPSCDAIFEETGRTYVVARADLGKRIRVAVEADVRDVRWHELASGLAYSPKTSPVTR
jgi:hypothetical protein